jgi:hypothetical protein
MASWRLPTSLPGGDMMPFMSARLRTQTVDALFEAAGGFNRALAWVDKSDENYGEFFKLWAKGAIRPTQIEHTAAEGLEDALARLDAGEHAKVVEGEIVE